MANGNLDALTPREREVLELLKLRWRNKEIASYLVIDESTVETHVHHVLAKLGYRTRQELWDAMKQD
jgi:DNA-binding NarL/FixJ family response regulator